MPQTAPPEAGRSQPPRRGLLLFMSVLLIVAGLAGMAQGLMSTFGRLRVLGPGGATGWDVAHLILLIFEGILLLTTGITGLRQDARTGASLMGTLSLLIALGWFVLACTGLAGPVLPPLFSLVLCALFLAGVRQAYPPPDSDE